MPVRSRGSLLAGTATLAGVLLVGLGCHASRSDHDSYSISPAAAQPMDGSLPPGGSVMPSSGYGGQPIARSGSTPVYATPSSPVTLHPVPMVQATGRREIIASNFQPVQRVSAVETISGPDLQGGAPPVANSTPRIPSRLPAGAPMPAGNSGVIAQNGPVVEDNAAASGNIVLPQPRPLNAAPHTVVYNDAVVPTHPPHPNVPREFEKMALPPYVVEPPDILLIQGSNRITLRLQPIQGQYLVTPDGMINLGIYGRIRVAGMTLEQVANAVAARLLEIMPGLQRGTPSELDKEGNVNKDSKDSAKVFEEEFQRDGGNAIELIKKELQVDVLAYNSKYYYVITDGGGYGQQVYPFLVTGNETVLDALAKVNGLPAVANKKKIWVARATRAGQAPKILPVDWNGVAKCGQSATNYQIFPGDRVYVDSSPLIKADTFLSKLYSPVLRTFGVTLLGASTVNSIKSGGSSGSGLGFIR